MLNRLKGKIGIKKGKPHLLISGFDLKFIEPAVKYLEKYYEIKVDPWKYREAEDLKDLMDWADIIFCEWLEYYVETYSNNLRDDQKLFVRAHKYEIINPAGSKINYDNVDGVITINYFLLELFSNVFSIPREKMFLMNNIIETSIYTTEKSEGYNTNIAIVGYMPHYKGFYRGLELLNILKSKNDDFKLYLIGKSYKDTQWKDDEVEISYFNKCDRYIEENNLEGSIVERGWIERKDMFSNIGYVLSLSDIEGSHLSPSEAFAASTISLLLKWPGVEYVYPKNLLFDNIRDITDFILNTYDDENKYQEISKPLVSYCEDEFSPEYFVDELIKIFNSNRTNKTKTMPISFDEFENKYIKNNEVDTDLLLKNFKNSFIINDESEIEDILENNEKAILFLSENIENVRIKNIYRKYASENVFIYSLHFYQNLDISREFMDLCNKIYRTDVKLN